MAKIKKTKTALKTQRDARERYERFLPTLELKKQQLRVEVHHLEQAIESKEAERREIRNALLKWIRLFAEENDFAALVRLRSVETEEDNIAGVSVPVFKDAVFDRAPVDLFSTSPWVDDGIDAIESLVRLRAEIQVLEEALERLSEELRVTSQRVNLFEKVKIPECRENIRVIKIALGDEQTAAVVRAKIAKSKMIELETATA